MVYYPNIKKKPRSRQQLGSLPVYAWDKLKEFTAVRRRNSSISISDQNWTEEMQERQKHCSMDVIQTFWRVFARKKKNIDTETAVEWNGQSFDEILPRGNLGS